MSDNDMPPLFDEDKFESIWIEFNVNHNYEAELKLADDEYIDYHIWEGLSRDRMYRKHLPKALVFSGNNPNLIFHGGCLRCLSQRLHGVDRCKGCMYFKCNWNKPDLKIEGEESHTLTQRDIDDLLS